MYINVFYKYINFIQYRQMKLYGPLPNEFNGSF